MMKKDYLIDLLGFIIVKAIIFILQFIPMKVSLLFGRFIGNLAYLTNTKRVSIAYANLKSALPEKSSYELKRIVRSHFEKLGMNLIEILKLPYIRDNYLKNNTHVKGIENIKEGISRNKGIIFLTAHFGNWEIASLAISFLGHKINVFAREQKYKKLNALLNKHREITGCRIITKGFSIRTIIKTLHNNGVTGMLSDQDAGANGIYVNFFGRPSSFAKGIVSLSLTTGASIIPAFIRRGKNNKHICEMGKILKIEKTGDKDKTIKENLKKIANILEEEIRKTPDEWLWTHKKWKSTPKRTVIILTDNKKGHINQSKGVSELIHIALEERLRERSIKELPEIDIKTYEIKFKSKRRRILLDIASLFANKRCQGCLKCLKYALTKESFDKIKNQYGDIIISCGSSLKSTNIYLKYENNAKNICIMNPGWGYSNKFDLVIMPDHDKPKHIKQNTLITDLAPNQFTKLQTSNFKLQTNNIGLLIGGDAKNFTLRKETVENTINDILKISEEKNINIYTSTSRRTSREIETLVKTKLRNHKNSKLLVIANEDNPLDTISKILTESNIIIVSYESISMISEAISMEKHVIVYGKDKNSCYNKYDKAVSSLKEKGYIKVTDVIASKKKQSDIIDIINNILINKPSIKKSNDADKIIKRLKQII